MESHVHPKYGRLWLLWALGQGLVATASFRVRARMCIQGVYEMTYIPGKPVAHNYGLGLIKFGYFYVACSFELLGFPERGNQSHTLIPHEAAIVQNILAMREVSLQGWE